MAEEQARPPYVQFEFRSIEDREASITAGHYVGKEVVFALVTPTGSRDRIEKEAEDWLEGYREGVRQDRIPAAWVTAYDQALKNFKESRETPEVGAPVKDWAGASVSQIKLLLDINVRTVEDLAAANEETVNRIGMGGRALKQKAQAWLDSAVTGKTAGELEKLRSENAELKTRDKQREAELKALKIQVEALAPKEEV